MTEKDSNPAKPPRDFSVLSDELQRKHQLVLTVWNALDAKIGILLGFTVVVLFGLILNVEPINSMAVSTHLTFSISTSTASSVAFWLISFVICPFVLVLAVGIAIINAPALWLFWFAFGSFVFVFAVGIAALFVKTFNDIETIDEADDFLEHSSITPELFTQRLSSLLYDYIIENEKHVKTKGFAVRLMTIGFVIGTALFLIRFGMAFL